MNNLNGGYIMIDMNSPRPQLLSQLEKALKVHKPVMVYDNDEVDFMTVKRYTENVILLSGALKFYRIFNDGSFKKCYRFNEFEIQKIDDEEFFSNLICLLEDNEYYRKLVISVYDVEAGQVEWEANEPFAIIRNWDGDTINTRMLISDYDEYGAVIGDMPIEINTGTIDGVRCLYLSFPNGYTIDDDVHLYSFQLLY